MKIERMEVVGINVNSLAKAVQFFADVLETDFHDFRLGGDIAVESRPVEHADTKAVTSSGSTRVAIDDKGYLELIEVPDGEEGLRNVHFKVPDLEEAKAEMKRKGVRLVAEHKVGGLKEAIFHPDDVFGIRLCLIEYQAPSMIAALLEGRGKK